MTRIFKRPEKGFRIPKVPPAAMLLFARPRSYRYFLISGSTAVPIVVKVATYQCLESGKATENRQQRVGLPGTYIIIYWAVQFSK